jgi:hypothetical protein
MYKRTITKYVSYKAADVSNYRMENITVWCKLFSKDLTSPKGRKFCSHFAPSSCLPASLLLPKTFVTVG